MGEMREQDSAIEASPPGEVGLLADRLAQCERDVLRKDAELARKEAQLADLARRLAAMVSADNARQVHFDNTRRINDNLRRINDDLRRERDALKKQLAAIVESRVWRLLTAVRKLRLRVIGTLGSR